ncbi:MAG: hypothetical protein EHM68_13215 [Lysobacterales bacterium]|nr:MAG: hypothetical protein EHM68_13215 [Xanthomonadales bacterium]
MTGNYRIYRYTSIGRSLDPAAPTNKAVLVLLPIAAVLGAALAWAAGGTLIEVLLRALNVALVLFVSWALAREMDPDDPSVAFISMAAGVLAAVVTDSPGVLAAFAALGLIRIVNRSTGLAARKSDSVLLVLLSIAVVYWSDSPLFGGVAALAFLLDGSLKDPQRRQWVFALLCLGAMVVYMVDHDVGLGQLGAPDSLFEWLSVLFLLMFALNIVLTRKISARGDVSNRPLDLHRVRGGMVVGLLAALQGVDRPEGVSVIVAAIAGICIGMAFRKGFREPSTSG